MPERAIIVRVMRYKPGIIDPQRFENHEIVIDEERTVLDCLETIRTNLDTSILFRHSCHHSSCGTCAMIINGVERLACITKIGDIEGNVIALEPLRGFPPAGDLVRNMNGFFNYYPEPYNYIRHSEILPPAAPLLEIKEFLRFENCIECGACVSACPVTGKKGDFMGPASLAAIGRELEKSPERSDELIALAGGERGERLCERALRCSKVCPMGVYPAMHIENLRKKRINA